MKYLGRVINIPENHYGDTFVVPLTPSFWYEVSVYERTEWNYKIRIVDFLETEDSLWNRKGWNQEATNDILDSQSYGGAIALHRSQKLMKNSRDYYVITSEHSQELGEVRPNLSQVTTEFKPYKYYRTDLPVLNTLVSFLV